MGHYLRRQDKKKPDGNNSSSFFKPAVQKKLKVGKSDDAFEKEADAVADQVVANGNKQDNVQKKGEDEEVQQKPLAAGITPLVQKQAIEEEPVQTKGEEEEVQKQEEEEPVQTKGEEEEVQKQEEEEAVQAKGEEEEVQKQEEEEAVQAKGEEEEVQKQEEEEAVQAKGEEEEVQKQEEEEAVQAKGEEEEVQKQEEEEAVQAKGEEEEVQKQEEEEAVQAKGEEEEVQKQEEEEAVQAKGEEEEVQKQEEEEAVQAKGEEEEVQKQEEEEAVQTKEVNSPTTASAKPGVEQRINQSKGKGHKMDDATKERMEKGFGADFDHVNIHTDEEAQQLSSDLGAQAFTHGNDIYFNQDKYNPSSSEGQHLLAHELTHTIQQKGMVQKKVQRASWKDIPAINRLKKGPTKTLSTRTLYTNQPPILTRQLFAKANISCTINWKSKLRKNPVDKRPTDVYTLTLKTTDFTTAAVIAELDKIIPKGTPTFIVAKTHKKEWKSLLKLVATHQKKMKKRFSDLQVYNLLQTGADPNECIGTMNLGVQELYGNKTIDKGKMGNTAIKSINALKRKKMATAPFNIPATYSGTKIPVDYTNLKELSKFKMKSPSAAIKRQLAKQPDGTYVYIVSLANGYHSTTFVVHKKGSSFQFLWKDQIIVQPYTDKELDHKVLRYQGGVSHADITRRYNKNNKTDYDSSDDLPKGKKYDLAAKQALPTTKKNIKFNHFSLLLHK